MLGFSTSPSSFSPPMTASFLTDCGPPKVPPGCTKPGCGSAAFEPPSFGALATLQDCLSVNSAHWSPDGAALLAVSQDNYLRVRVKLGTDVHCSISKWNINFVSKMDCCAAQDPMSLLAGFCTSRPFFYLFSGL